MFRLLGLLARADTLEPEHPTVLVLVWNSWRSNQDVISTHHI